MRVGGNIRWQLWHGRIFADVIEGAGNVESRVWYTKDTRAVRSMKYLNNELCWQENYMV